MPLTPPPSAPTAPGDVPSRSNPITFRALADSFVTWQVGFRTWLASFASWASTHVTEMQALQDDVTVKQVVAANAASSAATSSGQAFTYAAAAAAAVGQAQFADYTALRAYTGTSKAAYVTGYLVSSAPSGIAGLFTVDDSDTTSTDNGGTIIVASNGKRWKRLYSGPIDPRWFGAKLDFDTTGTDDTAALQAMFNAARDGWEVRFTSVAKITAGLTCNANNLTLSGAGGYTKSMISCATAGVQMLTVTGYGFKMRHMALQGDGGANGAGATVKGVAFLRADGSSDIDAEVSANSFIGLAEGVGATGRNVAVLGNLFSSSLAGVNFQRRNADECRGWRVNGNRFHSVGTIGTAAKCVVISADAFDFEVKGNFADSIYTFYEGPVNGSEIDNNNCYRVAGPGIDTVAATYLTQQRCGSVNGNLIFCNSPSYVGSAITLRMQNGQCTGNKVVGARQHGISLVGTTGSVIAKNTILSPNFNQATDGSIYDGISGDVASTNNLVVDNHVRSAGIQARSAINIAAGNTVGPNWIDSFYTTPYQTTKPLIGYKVNNTVTVNGSGVNGMEVEADASDGTKSTRVFFNNATTGQSVALLNNAGNLDLNVGATPGVSSGSSAAKFLSDGSVKFPLLGTTASAANAFLNSGDANSVLRSTSSLRYKTNIRDLTADKADRLLQLRPVEYESLAAVDRKDWTYYGLIAEEVALVEPRLVHYAYRPEDYIASKDGALVVKPGAQKVPDGVQYERLTVLLIAKVKELEGRLSAMGG